MYTLKKLFSVPIGHRLSKHCGLCKNIHGHNLKIEVVVKAEVLNDNDMVIDFSDLKVMVTDILDLFDHTTIVNSYDTETIDFLERAGYRIETISKDNVDPTAEVFSKYLFDLLRMQCYGQLYMIKEVTVWENDGSAATYSA